MEELDLREKGGVRDGERQTSDQRLFMHLLAFGDCSQTDPVKEALDYAGIDGVLYEDANDPLGIALLTWSDNPEFFLTKVRGILHQPPFTSLTPKLEYSMMGRTYAIGHEPDLKDWLMDKPRRSVTSPEWPWAIWYPLRRKGEFANIPPEEQGPILSEHGKIGHAFGTAGYAQDVRLACFGLDKNDNDFVIGLIGKELYPLSACIQAMRKTKQTSRYIQEMGPFFVGRAVWQKTK